MIEEIPQATSSGGIVAKIIYGEPKILLIRDKKYDNWTLPKGHLETGESLEEAASREIEEEAGIFDVEFVKEIGIVERYVEKAHEQKTIHYFLIKCPENAEPIVTETNKNDEIKWFGLDELPKFYLPEQEQIVRKNADLIRGMIK